MFNKNTDKNWESFGKNNPYFGVLSHKKYAHDNLTESNKNEFFKTGDDHVEHVFRKIRQHIDEKFDIIKALDFGCGVGRIVIPLSKIAQQVVGIDISESMLNEARRNCEERGITNIKFTQSDDQLSLIEGNFNFIHSFIVFQHMSIHRGEHILNNLLNILDDGGVGVLHFTYAKTISGLKRFIPTMKSSLPFMANIINLFNGESFFAPQMQMNSYDLNKILLALQNNSVSNLYVEYTDHNDCFGVIIYFQKITKRVPENIKI